MIRPPLVDSRVIGSVGQVCLGVITLQWVILTQLSAARRAELKGCTAGEVM